MVTITKQYPITTKSSSNSEDSTTEFSPTLRMYESQDQVNFASLDSEFRITIKKPSVLSDMNVYISYGDLMSFSAKHFDMRLSEAGRLYHVISNSLGQFAQLPEDYAKAVLSTKWGKMAFDTEDLLCVVNNFKHDLEYISKLPNDDNFHELAEDLRAKLIKRKELILCLCNGNNPIIENKEKHLLDLANLKAIDNLRDFQEAV